MGCDTVVIFRSKTGFAKKYAEWIAEELQCDLLEGGRLSVNDISQYQTIIYGAGLYASGINGISFIKKNLDVLRNKNLIVFATGATPPREEDVQKVWKTNFSEEQRKKLNLFYFRGGFDFSKLSGGNKLLMNMMKMMLKKQKTPSDDVTGMLEAYDKPVDFTDRNNILPLLELVGKLRK